MTLIDRLHERLIADWRKGHKLWSIRLSGFGLFLQTLFLSWGALPLDIWRMMPDEVRDIVPRQIAFALPALFFGAAMIARFIQQGKKDADPSDG